MDAQKNKPVTQTFPITPQGSLGLLALGAKGVMAWRAAKRNAQIEQDASK